MKKENPKVSQFYYKKSRLQQLRGFCATIRNGCSIREGAKEIGLEEGAVSIQIRSLEKELNVRLFDRVNRRLILTEKGQILYKDAVKLIADADNLFNKFILKNDEDYSNTLRIATNSFILIKLIPYIAEFEKKYPNIKLDIDIDSLDIALKSLSDRKIDILISNKENNANLILDLDFIELIEYKPYLLLYKGHYLENIKSNDITKEDLIKSNLGFNYDSMTMNSLKAFIDDYNLVSAVNIKDYNLLTQKTLVKNKMCIWILFDIFLNEEDDFIFKNLGKIFPCGRYGCLINKSHKPIAEIFCNYLYDKRKEIFRTKFLEEKVF